MLISNSIGQPVYSRNGHGHAPAVPSLPCWTTTPREPSTSTDSFSCRSPQQAATASMAALVLDSPPDGEKKAAEPPIIEWLRHPRATNNMREAKQNKSCEHTQQQERQHTQTTTIEPNRTEQRRGVTGRPWTSRPHHLQGAVSAQLRGPVALVHLESRERKR